MSKEQAELLGMGLAILVVLGMMKLLELLYL